MKTQLIEKPHKTEFITDTTHHSMDIQLKIMSIQHCRWETNDYVDYIIGDTRYFYPKSDLYLKGGHLIKAVKSDFEKFIFNNPNFEIIPDYQPFYSNESSNNYEKIVYYDLNHAYWRFAFLKGYISEKTYNKGLESEENKQLYCIALSTQGAEKRYNLIVNKKKSIEVKTTGFESYRQIYNNIRNYTYKAMDDMKKILKADFRGYNVDCICFIDTKENREIIEKYLFKNKLLYKIETKSKI